MVEFLRVLVEEQKLELVVKLKRFRVHFSGGNLWRRRTRLTKQKLPFALKAVLFPFSIVNNSKTEAMRTSTRNLSKNLICSLLFVKVVALFGWNLKLHLRTVLWPQSLQTNSYNVAAKNFRENRKLKLCKSVEKTQTIRRWNLKYAADNGPFTSNCD